MRFGLFVPQGWRLDLAGIDPADHWPAMLGVARAAEAGPFESVWVFDHFHTVPVPTQEATHEAWTLMAALGAATSRVRLGQMCTCVGYRNPAYLAKVAATVDITTTLYCIEYKLSNGSLINATIAAGSTQAASYNMLSVSPGPVCPA